MAGVQRSRRQCERILAANGFKYHRSSGGHNIYKRNPGETVSLPSHVNAMIFEVYIKKYKLTV